MTFNDNSESTYFIISEGNDNEDSLMLKIELFPTHQDYVNTLGTNSVSSLNKVEHDNLDHDSNPSCTHKNGHNLKSKLRSRISTTFRKVNNRSWVSSRDKLKSGQLKHDQICEFINVAVNQSMNSNHNKHQSVKIKKVEKMDNSDQCEESTYNSQEHSKCNKMINETSHDACQGLISW